MNFIETLFGLSRDGRSGALEGADLIAGRDRGIRYHEVFDDGGSQWRHEEIDEREATHKLAETRSSKGSPSNDGFFIWTEPARPRHLHNATGVSLAGL